MPAGTASWINLSDRIVSDLGGGMIDVELTPTHLNNAISESLREFRATSSPATKEGWMFLDAIENQRFYSMPDYVIDISDIQRLDYGFIAGIEGTQFGTYLYEFFLSGEPFDITNYYLQRSFLETLNLMSAATVNYVFHSSFDGNQIGYGALDNPTETDNIPDTSAEMGFDNLSRLNGPVLEILQLPKNSTESYLLNVRFARSDAELINDMETGPWIHQYARACAKINLGIAYRTFDGMPGPGGGMSLPGNDLIQEGKEEKEMLKQDLLDLKYGEEAYGIMMG